MQENFSILNKTKSALPIRDSVFFDIKNAILGEAYELSLVFIGKKKSRELNMTYRQKDNPTNILSFPLDKKSGEIFITPSVVQREYKKFEEFKKNYREFMKFLFIHGLLHLKGMEHGSTMDRAEKKWLAKLQLE